MLCVACLKGILLPECGCWPAEVTLRVEQPVDSSGGHGPLGCASLLFGLVVVSIHY